MPFENLLNISVKKDWVDYLSALLTPTVALFGLYIGYRQWRTEEAKLRHELFERRYKQFDAVVKFLNSILYKDNMTNDGLMRFLSETEGMNFIFDEEIDQFVDNYIFKLYMELRNSEPPLISPFDEKIDLGNNRRTELGRNLLIFKEKTLKYMQLEQPSLSKKLWRHLAALWEKIQKAAEE